MFDLIAFDADDTLWHNESLYAETERKLRELLLPYVDGNTVAERLYQTEMRNLPLYGYGIKGFALSMIETAIELTGGGIPAMEILQVIELAKEMLAADVVLFEHAEETLSVLAEQYPLMLITKGDLRDQQVKLAQSQIDGYFRYVEVVSDKTEQTYATLLDRHGVAPAQFLMVGNSLRSDVLPVLALGASAVYIPYDLTWLHEQVEGPQAGQDGFFEVEHLGQVPALIERLRAG
jgi:putative hydrolase of the HAD superfamily